MIAADKNLLRATLTRGMLQLQLKLIDLYVNNLNALSVSGVLISGFAYTGLVEIDYPTTGTEANTKPVEYIYYFAVTLALASGLFLVSQATIVVVFAAAKALKGNTPETVIEVVKNIQGQQKLIFKTGIVVITSLFVHCIAMIWTKATVAVSIFCSILYVICYIFIAAITYHFYQLFHPPQTPGGDVTEATDDALKDTLADTPVMKTGYKALRTNDATALSDPNGPLEQAKKASNTKAQGLMFWRSALSAGAHFREVYAVIERGSMDIYKKENDYLNHENPINKRPFKLSEYELVTDYRKFSNHTSDFGMADTMISSYDLKTASKKFKFCLSPKVESELNATGVVELMATDDEAYRLWTKTLAKIIKAFAEIEKYSVASQPKSAKLSSVENVVEAAIKSRIV